MSIIKIIGIAAGVAAAGLAGLAMTNPGNTAETSDDSTDEGLKTRYYQVDLRTFVEETKKMIPKMTTYGQSWKLAGGGSEAGDGESQHHSETLIVEVPVAFFVDDLEINAVKEADADKVKVSLRSKSRTGKSDLGENRRHVLQLLEALDEKFNRQ